MDKKTDVKQEDSSTSTEEEKKPVEGKDSTEEKDKETNFAELRKAKEAAERENAELKAKLEAKESNDFSLGKKTEDKPEVEYPEALFNRDMKEATRKFTKENEVTSEQWAHIKSKVELNGNETESEIADKIQEAYQSLPDVRAKREEELINKGKKLAMQQFGDEELDIGGGGDVDMGGSPTPRIDSKSKDFARNVGGLDDKEIAESLNDDSDPNSWKEGKEPVRKFFQP